MPLRYLIVDDEEPGRLNLRLAMAAHPGWVLAAECDSAARARKAMAGGDIDVIFLDIQMPMESGVALAREISHLREPPLIVFVTAYSAHAVEAFEVHALDYLLKPLDDVRLAQAVQRGEAMLALRQREAFGEALRTYVDADSAQYLDRINVRSVGRIEQVHVADILWIEAAGNYVELNLDARTVLHRIPLGRLETLLDPAQFVRVHRGALVRRDQLAGLAVVGDGSYRLSLRCGALVAVSERHIGAVRDCMG
jgi:two-component system LytT family response regulator